jgi:hypothetical protein
MLPRQAGAGIIEINLERTVLSGHLTDVLLLGKATEMVLGLLSAVRELKGL